MKLTPLVAMLVLLMGCSAPATNAATAPPASPVSSPSASGATPAQWASAVAPLKADWQEMQDSWDAATCSSLAVDDGAVDCAAYLTAMGFQAQTIDLLAQAMADPGAKSGYLGTPPGELVTAYRGLAWAAHEAAALAEAGIDCPGKKCLTQAFKFQTAWKKLGSALEAWEPWL